MMINPSLEELKKATENFQANTFPVSSFILANNLTPHVAYLKLARPSSKNATPSFLFESAIGGEKLDRFSFIGVNPRKILRSGPGYGKEQDPLVDLEIELKRYRQDEAFTSTMPSLSGGAIGYISYDCIRYFEPTACKTELKDVLKLPESALMFFDTIVAFDNVYQRIQVIHNIHFDGQDEMNDVDVIEAKYNEAENIIDSIITTLKSGEDYTIPQPPVTPNDEFVSNIGQEGYESHVRELRKHILAGDIIQAVPSQRVSHKTDLHPFNVYRHLRTVNPSPYLFYIDYLDFQLVGASPELLVKNENSRVITHPIAGTVKRGKTTQEDDALAAELLSSTKDRAEHVMLVDLARNDINRSM